MTLLSMLILAIFAAFLITKAGLLTFASVALGIFWVLHMGGCSGPTKRPYCETRAVHQARVHLEHDPDVQPLFNENGLPIVDDKVHIVADDSGRLVHSKGL